MGWITPKTNWTTSDYYNVGDLNRVENNIAEVRSYLVLIGYNVPSITTKTNRSTADYDLVSSINRIESNLETIKTAFVTPLDWQPTINWTAQTKLTADIANRWETSALNLYSLAQNTYAAFVYCGNFVTGNQGGLA